MQPRYEIRDVLDQLGDGIEQIGLNKWQLRTLYALKKCRTSSLGGHIDACDECGEIRISYNSCRNRHCPKCQGNNREEWIAARERELLPVPYFHVVFTLPEALNALALHDPQAVYGVLFESAWQTISVFSKSKKLKSGMIAVLHTWGQNLSLHPHLHCIVPGGGVDVNGRWQALRRDGKFLFPVKALSKVFRGKYCHLLQIKSPDTYQSLRAELWKKPWVVYAKRPFGSPSSVVEYLGRYTHKVAISHHRLREVGDSEVVIDYKDYRQGGMKKQMRLRHVDFIKRFSLHILPKRFVKIRHYGILSSTWKREKLVELQYQMTGIRQEPKREEEKPLPRCESCGKGNMQRVLIFDERGPPKSQIGAGHTRHSCSR